MFARYAVLTVILTATGVAGPARALARDGVREQLQKQLAPTADLIVKVMQSEKLKKISFGEFATPKGPESAYATGMREELIACVMREAAEKKYAIEKVETGGDLEVLANMRYAQSLKDADGKDHPAAIQVRFTLDKSTGPLVVPAPIQQLLQKAQVPGVLIADGAIAAEATGSNIVFKAGSSVQKDLEDLNKNKKNPDATFQLVDGKLVRAQPGSPYGVEILVVDESRIPKDAKDWDAIKPRTIGTTKDGKNPFVDLKPGEAYAIRITNNTKFDAAVEISIDGLDVFHFVDEKLRKPDGRSKYTCYIVARAEFGGYGVIPGWHKDNAESLAFVVREHGKGAVSKVKPKDGNPGVINVRIAGAWNEKEDPPIEIRGKNAGKNETDTGAPIKTGFVEVKKEIGKFNTIISIHYSH